jgi:hypothetical protein
MDPASLASLFATSYDSNPNIRRASELEIRRVWSLYFARTLSYVVSAWAAGGYAVESDPGHRCRWRGHVSTHNLLTTPNYNVLTQLGFHL